MLTEATTQEKNVWDTIAESWPELREIKTELPPAPEFDAHAMLPKPLADFVLDEADRMTALPLGEQVVHRHADGTHDGLGRASGMAVNQHTFIVALTQAQGRRTVIMGRAAGDVAGAALFHAFQLVDDGVQAHAAPAFLATCSLNSALR